MRNILLSLLVFTVVNVVAQTSVIVDPALVRKAVSENFTSFYYVDEHPKIMCGTYFKRSENERNGFSWTNEVEITLNEDGTCKTRWYNSGYVGRKPKTKIVEGTWGLAVNPKTNKLATKAEENGTWYEIVLKSNDGSPLAYYDRKVWYDKVLIENNNTTYLKLIFSSGEKVKKQ